MKVKYNEFNEFQSKINNIDNIKIRIDYLKHAFELYTILYAYYINGKCIGNNIQEVYKNCKVTNRSYYRLCTIIRLVFDLDIYKLGNKGYFVDIAEYK
jgi:hypothetical protein